MRQRLVPQLSLFAGAVALASLAACSAALTGPRSSPPPAKVAWRVLEDGSLATGAATPRGLHVRGRLEAGRFVAEGEVEGEGELGRGGHPGWMELADGSFHGNETGRAPIPPYVEGALGDDGKFRPSSRAVVRR